MDDFERRIDRELKALPAPVAPRTLLPRVMAAVAAAQPAPWYSRAWLTWPRAAQVASLLVLAALATAAWMAMPAVSAWTGDVETAGAPIVARVAVVADPAERVLAVGRVIWLVFLQPVVFYLAQIAVVASLMGAACWAAVTRLVPGGASLQ
jgi:hypothetical protein